MVCKPSPPTRCTVCVCVFVCVLVRACVWSDASIGSVNVDMYIDGEYVHQRLRSFMGDGTHANVS